MNLAGIYKHTTVPLFDFLITHQQYLYSNASTFIPANELMKQYEISSVSWRASSTHDLGPYTSALRYWNRIYPSRNVGMMIHYLEDAKWDHCEMKFFRDRIQVVFYLRPDRLKFQAYILTPD